MLIEKNNNNKINRNIIDNFKLYRKYKTVDCQNVKC